jgi:hypothetical protein
MTWPDIDPMMVIVGMIVAVVLWGAAEWGPSLRRRFRFWLTRLRDRR